MSQCGNREKGRGERCKTNKRTEKENKLATTQSEDTGISRQKSEENETNDSWKTEGENRKCFQMERRTEERERENARQGSIV